MKLYYTPKAPAGRRWIGTQIDAKQAAKEFASPFSQREVPVDKPNLLTFLNNEEQLIEQQERLDATAIPDSLDPLQQAELRAVAAAQAPAATPAPQQLTTDAIVAFILDDATVAQAGHILEALGTRIKEHVNATR